MDPSLKERAGWPEPLALQEPLSGQEQRPTGGNLMENPRESNNAKEQPVSELLTQLSQQTSRLVRDELRLAQAELRADQRRAPAHRRRCVPWRG